MEKYIGQKFDEERALYNLKDVSVIDCVFEGEKDGESALKECQDVEVKNTTFSLRYPLWCVNNALIDNIKMTETCRSPIWYSHNMKVNNSLLNAVKLFRFCTNIEVNDCEINSIEFAWNATNFQMNNCNIVSEYPFLRANDVKVLNCNFNTKYPFQQATNVYLENVTIDAKDAFWDSSNIVCKNCTLIGDFLAWYSKDLTLINCTIISSQPLCYCENIKLVDCIMEECDLGFEYASNVDVTIKGNIKSIKNPRSGVIKVDSVDEVILTDNSVYEKECNIIINK